VAVGLHHQHARTGVHPVLAAEQAGQFAGRHETEAQAHGVDVDVEVPLGPAPRPARPVKVGDRGHLGPTLPADLTTAVAPNRSGTRRRASVSI